MLQSGLRRQGGSGKLDGRCWMLRRRRLVRRDQPGRIRAAGRVQHWRGLVLHAPGAAACVASARGGRSLHASGARRSFCAPRSFWSGEASLLRGLGGTGARHRWLARQHGQRAQRHAVSAIGSGGWVDGRRQWPTEGADGGDRWGCCWRYAAQLQQGRGSTAPGSSRLERARRGFPLNCFV